MNKFIFISATFLFIACSASKKAVKTELRDNQTFVITKTSTDTTYGLSAQNPVEVGGVDKSEAH
jgi:hypothetical protein